MTKLHSKDSEFDWLANIYNSHSAINHPSELHGLLIGHLAGGLRFSPDQWLALVLEHMGAEDFDLSRQVHLKEDLQEFCQSVDQEIAQDSACLELLLPDEDYTLTERAEALAIWVRGFLEGMAIAANNALAKVEEDLQELLRDLVNISQMDARVEAGEQGERELFEVCEYVKIAVLNLYAEFNQPSASVQDSNPNTLH
ncbi:MAG: YecA family protein [Oleiphilus sp.]|nr:MAG: YecA family protein [Oleiphilus sp.]